MTVSLISDHVVLGLAKLREHSKGQPNTEALLTALMASTNSIELALYELLTERQVDTAIGAQLDLIGFVVGEERAGKVDADYRRYIRARIAINNSSGLISDIVKVSRLVINDTATSIEVENQTVATVVVTIWNNPITTALASILLTRLQEAAAAGVRVILEYASGAIADVFTFDDATNTWDVGEWSTAIDEA